MKLRHLGLSIFFILSALSLSGCKLALLQPKGMIAADEKNILYIAVLLMLIIVVPVISLTFYFAWRYRESNKNAVYQPNWSHNTMIEVVCWVVPCIIIAILATITWTSTHRLDPYRPIDGQAKPMTIQVIALEWKWLFIYPEQKVAAVNYVKFPVNRQVRFMITSEGPMNSFQIPQLAGQIYAMAGMQTKLHVVGNEIGDYRGISTNFSGDGFSGMRFVANVCSQSEFDNWVSKLKKSPNRLTMSEYKKLLKQSSDVPVTLYSLADKNIYHYSIMKYMMPMAHKKEMK